MTGAHGHIAGTCLAITCPRRPEEPHVLCSTHKLTPEEGQRILQELREEGAWGTDPILRKPDRG